MITYIPQLLRPVKIVGLWRHNTHATVVESVEPNGGHRPGVGRANEKLKYEQHTAHISGERTLPALLCLAAADRILDVEG